MVARLLHRTGAHLARLLAARYSAPAILIGTLILAGGSARALTGHDGQPQCRVEELGSSFTLLDCPWYDAYRASPHYSPAR